LFVFIVVTRSSTLQPPRPVASGVRLVEVLAEVPRMNV